MKSTSTMTKRFGETDICKQQQHAHRVTVTVGSYREWQIRLLSLSLCARTGAWEKSFSRLGACICSFRFMFHFLLSNV